MKKIILALSVVSLFTGANCFAQNKENSEKKWSISVNGGVGVAEVTNEDEQVLFGHNSNSILSVDYSVNNNLALGLGVKLDRLGYSGLDGKQRMNRFVGLSFNTQYGTEMTDNLFPFVSLGLYGKSLVTSDVYTKGKTASDTFVGYTSGLSMGIGVVFGKNSVMPITLQSAVDADFLSTVKVNNQKHLFGTNNIMLGLTKRF